MMQLSVIIPVFNAERYLRRCLDSVLTQTMSDLEVICIDDGSTDSSSAILSEYAAADGRVRVISQSNVGQGAARNRGIDAAQGECLCFVDADDALFGVDALKVAIGEMALRGVQLLMYDALVRFEDGGDSNSAVIGKYRRRRQYPEAAGTEMFVAMNSRNEFSVSPCLYVVDRKALLESGVRFDEGVVHEDDIFTLSLLFSIRRVGHLNRPLYERWVHPGSTMTSGAVERHLRGYLLCIRWVEDRLHERTLPTTVLRELRRCRIGYRHIARSLAEKSGLPPPVDYPFCEKMANLLRCLRDRGLRYTVRRIVLCGRKM